MTTFEKVVEIVVDQLSVDPDDVAIESTFIDDLGADSLDIVEIISRDFLKKVSTAHEWRSNFETS